MTGRALKPSLEDVLNAFAVEGDFGPATLERYLREYPAYAEELIDLSFELNREVDSSSQLSTRDEALIEQSWRRHNRAGRNVDLLAALSTQQLRDIAHALDIPRQVLTAFRERSILVASVPRAFLSKFAEQLGAGIDDLWASLISPPAAALERSYKADGRPTPVEQVTFERALTEAGVPEDKRARLLAPGE